MDKKYTDSAVSRRDALKKIGQCAEYTGAVVAFLTVSKPTWASVGVGTKPGCRGLGLTVDVPPVDASGCLEVDVNRYGARASGDSSAKVSGVGQFGASSSAVSNQSTGGINNSVSLKVNNAVESEAVVGPSYQ